LRVIPTVKATTTDNWRRIVMPENCLPRVTVTIQDLDKDTWPIAPFFALRVAPERLFRTPEMLKRALASLLWIAVVVAGASAYAMLALHRSEQLNSAYILVAALCSYAIGYRFYSKWIAARVLTLNDQRATPCEVHDDGKDFDASVTSK
jgi:hypothetical protein